MSEPKTRRYIQNEFGFLAVRRAWADERAEWRSTHPFWILLNFSMFQKG
jgi:hypothetical protein